MFCESLWQNMKIFVYCIAWSSITTLSNFLTLVSSLSCKGFSRDTQPLLQLLPAQFIWNQSYVEIVQDFKDVVFATDPCDRAKMAYAPISGAHQGKVLATSDAFQKTSVVLHIADSLIGGRPTLSHLVFLSGGLLAIINNEIFIFDFHSFLAKKTKGIQRADGVDMLSVHECCAVDYSCQVWGNVVLAYKLYSSTREFYYSQDGGLGFSKATISPTHSYKLLSSTVLAVDLTALFLAEDVQTSKLLLLTIPLNGFMHGQAEAPNSSVILLSEFDSYIPGDFIHMLQLRSDFYSLLLWDRHGILYKRRLDLEGVRIVVHNSGSNSTFLPKEHTRLADTNSLGEFLMITSHNRLLYGRESYIPEATYVTNLTFTLSNSTVMAFNDGGDVVILSPADTNKVDLYSARYLSTIHLPDEILKLSNIAPCPYQSLKADRLHHYYLIDIHGSVDLITIVYTDEMSNISIAVQTSAGQRLQLYNSISHTPTKQGLISHEMRTRAVPKRATYLSLLSRADRPLESGQGTALRVVTSSTSLSCPENSQNVAHITLGCEKGKRLVINREPGLCDKLAHSATYEIPAEFYDDDQGKYGGKQATKPKTVTYNFRRYGCANKTYYNNPFIFDLHLYQDATYLGPMKGDYVIYEVNGVNKFNYSLTLNTSGCAVRPQTWREMLLSAPDNASMDEVWTRKNYRNCNILYDNHPRNQLYSAQPQDSYEILNYDNGNYLTFTKNGFYIFEIIVVDNEYSLCDLRAHLAVEVFGVQPEVPVGYFWIMGGSLGCLLILMLIIFIIVNGRRRLRLAEEKEMNVIEAFDDIVNEHLTEEVLVNGLPAISISPGANRRGTMLRTKYSISRPRHSMSVKKGSNG